jgi:uncharacterized protein (TIGR02449 family)
MLEQLDALSTRLHDLVALVRQLRDENYQLRTQLAGARAETEALNARIGAATERLDALIARIPSGEVPGSGAQAS